VARWSAIESDVNVNVDLICFCTSSIELQVSVTIASPKSSVAKSTVRNAQSKATNYVDSRLVHGMRMLARDNVASAQPLSSLWSFSQIMFSGVSGVPSGGVSFTPRCRRPGVSQCRQLAFVRNLLLIAGWWR
jgi:hypothetical protein